MGNGLASTFAYDLNDRLTQIQHARDVTSIFKVGYGYDAAGNRTHKYDYVRPERTELYEYDRLDRLRGFARGVPDANPPTEIDTPLADADLASAQTWTTMDRRGNWRVYDTTLDQASASETRTRNGVNEYESIDPDGPDAPGGPLEPVSLVYDDGGNLTLDPLAAKAGDDPNAPSGQVYSYDEENRLTAVRDAREPNQPPLLEIEYDSLGRRAASID